MARRDTVVLQGRSSHERYCDLVDEEIRRFIGVARVAAPEQPVPTCGGWKVRDLVHHVGLVHRWAAGMVAERSRVRHGLSKSRAVLPDDASCVTWLEDGRARLLDALRAADPQARMWAWGPDKHVRFWSRRMLHETTIHRVDAELATGSASQIEAEIAADGVDEFLQNAPKSRVRSRRHDSERIALVALDAPDRWVVTLSETSFGWTPPGADDLNGADEVSVTVTAKVVDLYLLVWQRRHHRDDGYAVTGDATLLDHWRAGSAL